MPDPLPNPVPRPVKITEVSYGMTVSRPNFENVRFSFTAEVAQDEDWREVLESLRRKARKLRQRINEEGD
jgi:hypothetical protein